MYIYLVLFVSYKEGEKAVDELRKYYSAQAAKHKENMEQAVSHKVWVSQNFWQMWLWEIYSSWFNNVDCR